MSSTAYWKPVTPKEGNCLSDDLKRKIARRYMGHDGSLSGSVFLNHADMGWLEGLRDGGVKGADKLVDAINKHDDIEVWIE